METFEFPWCSIDVFAEVSILDRLKFPWCSIDVFAEISILDRSKKPWCSIDVFAEVSILNREVAFHGQISGLRFTARYQGCVSLAKRNPAHPSLLGFAGSEGCVSYAKRILRFHQVQENDVNFEIYIHFLDLVETRDAFRARNATLC